MSVPVSQLIPHSQDHVSWFGVWNIPADSFVVILGIYLIQKKIVIGILSSPPYQANSLHSSVYFF